MIGRHRKNLSSKVAPQPEEAFADEKNFEHDSLNQESDIGSPKSFKPDDDENLS